MTAIDVRLIGSQAFLVDVIDGQTFRFAGFNDALCAVLGIAPELVRGRSPANSLGPAFAALVEPRYRYLLATKRIYEYEEELEIAGERRWWRTTLLPIVDPLAGTVVQILGVPVDITQRRRAAEALEAAALLDPLTGIGNRRAFDRALAHAMIGAEALVRGFALALFDVDRFKAINDREGHAAGDTVLKAFAARLAAACGSNDRVARLGGDEFALILAAETNVGYAERIEAVAAALNRPVAFGDRQLDVGASVGWAPWTDSTAVADLLAAADAAMYRTKRQRAA